MIKSVPHIVIRGSSRDYSDLEGKRTLMQPIRLMRAQLMLTLVLALVVCLSRADDSRAQGEQPYVGPLGDTTHQAILEAGDSYQAQPPRSRSNPLSFMNMILNPIKSTLDHTRKFLSRRVDHAQDGLDKVRLQAYRLFLHAFNKSVPALDELRERANIFFSRREAIRQSVQAFREGRDTFSMKLNEFVDWNDDELKQLTGVSMPPPEEMTAEERQALNGQGEARRALVRRRLRRSLDRYRYRYDAGATEPENGTEIEVEPASGPIDSWDENSYEDEDDDIGINVGQQVSANKDWRQSGCIAEPIDQKNCGACYAIATIGTLETMRCLNQDGAATLSSQQVVDCSTGYKNYGCNGGWPTRVLRYLQDNQRITREVCYPFVRRQGACKARLVATEPGCALEANVRANSGQLRFKVLNSERDILYYVATQGPVVTVMRASNKFLYYGQGIFDDRSCSNRKDDVDHAIQIVGYGKENGIDYWLIKNSWGKTWGQQGYGKYKRGTHACSIGYWGWAILP